MQKFSWDPFENDLEERQIMDVARDSIIRTLEISERGDGSLLFWQVGVCL